MKKIKSFLYKCFIRLREKKKVYGRRVIKYLLFKEKKSKELIVVFSAFPGEGNGSSKYNYIKSLKNVRANKLYILDNFGYQGVGTYYLGDNGNLDLRNILVDFIRDICKTINATRLITVGSSKGGTSAIFYGTLLNANMVIAGAPQYFIGDYLNSNDYNKKILRGVLGSNFKTDDVKMLNNLLRCTIEEEKNRKTIYVLGFSKKEHTYDEHIKYLIDDLNKNKKRVILEEDSYDFHDNVGKQMPVLFNKYLSEVEK